MSDSNDGSSKNKAPTTKINVVNIGHKSSGKSSMAGHMAFKYDKVDKSMLERWESERSGSSSKLSWVVDTLPEERKKDMSINFNYTTFQTTNYSVTLFDVPGGKDYIENMIAGVFGLFSGRFIKEDIKIKLLNSKQIF